MAKNYLLLFWRNIYYISSIYITILFKPASVRVDKNIYYANIFNKKRKQSIGVGSNFTMLEDRYFGEWYESPPRIPHPTKNSPPILVIIRLPNYACYGFLKPMLSLRPTWFPSLNIGLHFFSHFSNQEIVLEMRSFSKIGLFVVALWQILIWTI